MSAPKFTPGPWHVSLGRIAGVKGEHEVVTTDRAAVGVFSDNKEVREANAHLIAAAPDLFAALEKSVRCISALMPGADDFLLPEASRVAVAARAALAKARGA